MLFCKMTRKIYIYRLDKMGWILSDREGHGHKAVVYKSHFPPLRHFSCNRDTSGYLANKPRLTKDQALCSLCPHDRFHENSKNTDPHSLHPLLCYIFGVHISETLMTKTLAYFSYMAFRNIARSSIFRNL